MNQNDDSIIYDARDLKGFLADGPIVGIKIISEKEWESVQAEGRKNLKKLQESI